MKKFTLKKILTYLVFISATVYFNKLNAQFTQGNLVVLRIGNDTTKALTSNAYPVFLDELTKSGKKVKTYKVPVSGSARLVLGGTSTSEGQLTLAADSSRLVIAGYDAAVGALSVAKTNSSSVKRVVDIALPDGSFKRAASSDTFFSQNNFRSACTDDGENFWGAGSSTGTVYLGKDTAAILQKFTTNTRVINVYKGQLYFSTGSTSGDSGIGVYRVGNGLPKTSGQNFTPIALTGATSSPYAFVFNAAGNTLYIANEDTATGAVQKWMKQAGTWKLKKTFALGPRTGARGLCIDFKNKRTPTIYAVTTTGTVVKFKDTGIVPKVVVIYTAKKNTIIRGIQFAPASGSASFSDEINTAPYAAVANKNNAMKLYPNPVTGASAKLAFNSMKAETYSLKITTVSGNVVAVQQGNLIKGDNNISVNISSLKKGMYVAEFITTQGANNITFEKR